MAHTTEIVDETERDMYRQHIPNQPPPSTEGPVWLRRVQVQPPLDFKERIAEMRKTLASTERKDNEN